MGPHLSHRARRGWAEPEVAQGMSGTVGAPYRGVLCALKESTPCPLSCHQHGHLRVNEFSRAWPRAERWVCCGVGVGAQHSGHRKGVAVWALGCCGLPAIQGQPW